ncbi:hypothetical protein [Pseudomonas sp. EA_15y_Pfl1_P102]|uniref:hypothetical protein n=1 Tax=Pseudomonas sp. EA_15y_Pfl1_P102 TaxID=3088685 RepID=UPI0030D9FAE3
MLLIGACSDARSASLEDQVVVLQNSVKTVEDRQKSALKDIRENVIKRYRDAIQIYVVETKVSEVFEKTVEVSVSVRWKVDRSDAESIKTTLDKYFMTSSGIEFEMVSAQVDFCNHNEFCAVNKSLSKYMKKTAVGIDASFLGDWEPAILMDGWGRFPLSGSMTYSFKVPKSKIKGNPQPVVKAQIYDVIACDPSTGCTAKLYDRRRSDK